MAVYLKTKKVLSKIGTFFMPLEQMLYKLCMCFIMKVRGDHDEEKDPGPDLF